MSLEVALPVIMTIISAATPLLLAGIGELVVERSGVLNLGVEGMLLAGAVTAFAVTLATGSHTLGIVAAALAAMLLPFRMGAGGKIGNGRQYVSWIALDDVLGALYHIMYHDELSGPVNIVAPQAAPNYEFTKTLGRVLRRPTIFPMPTFAARLAFGEMADALLLSSQRVMPKKLLDSGFAFTFGELTAALRHILGKNAMGDGTPC